MKKFIILPKTYQCAICGMTKQATYISPKNHCKRVVENPNFASLGFAVDTILPRRGLLCGGKMIQIGGQR